MSDPIFNVPTEITINETVVKVHCVKVKDVTPLLKVVNDIAPLFVSKNFTPDALEGKIDSVVLACTTLSDASVEFVNELTIDDLILLATAVVEKNASFFSQKLTPMVQSLMGKVTEAAKQVKPVGKKG